jgi:hypothetical protein
MSAKHTPGKWKCIFGFHRWVSVEPLITMTTARCQRCNARLISSLFGDFVQPASKPEPNE